MLVPPSKFYYPIQVIKASDIPEDKLRAFLDSFSGRRERILWKWEAEESDMPGKPSNIMLKKWLPQQVTIVQSILDVVKPHGMITSIRFMPGCREKQSLV